MRTFAVFLLLAFTPALGQLADKTAGSYNGRYWLRCPMEVKAGIVVGFGIAIQNPIGTTADAREKFSLSGTIGDTMKALDAFYGEEDVQMPIWMALRLIKLHRDGATDSQIEAEFDLYGRRVTPAK